LFSGGFTEIGFILFIAFLLFGPKKLPEIARILGKGMGELRRASNELKFSLEEEIRNLDRTDDTSYSAKDNVSYPEEDNVSYPEEETYPYLENKVETSEPLEETSEPVEEEAHDEAHEEAHSVEPQSEGDLEPAPKYGYDYSEAPHEEPEPRP
jgi:sec-independent protein translocase protein TatB